MTETVNKIPMQTMGPEYLAASHFKIGQDQRWAPSHDPIVYKSTFKKDYPPLPLIRSQRIPSPPPAGIMHKDDRHVNHQSVTRLHFVEKPVSPIDFSNASYALTKTNFKMDADKQIKTFETTHARNFPPRSLTEAHNPPLVKDKRMKSNIPQGDQEKELLPASDYRSHFQGAQLDADTVPVTVHLSVFGGPPTIKGDERSHYHGQFSTTNKSEFIGHFKPRQPINPSYKLGGSNIPQGDQEKCLYSLSTMQDSYQPQHADRAPFNRKEAVQKIRATSFQLGDKRSPGKLKSTAAESYIHHDRVDANESINLNMGKSSFPEGDLDPVRALDRISKTTNDYLFSAPPPGFHNPIIRGSHLRTKSHIDFGTEDGSKYYDTSMRSDYTSVSLPQRKPLVGMTAKSSIPLDYYGNEVNLPTTWTDFPHHPPDSRLIPNPIAVEKLKGSNIKPPMPGERHFSTTHKSDFTPKENKNASELDVGRLQRSSVPLGTLHLY